MSYESIGAFTKADELHAIVRDLADCDPHDDEMGDCTLCRVINGHDTTCPYLRAVRLVSKGRP